jgi:anti-sigma-K factor RskA
MSAHDPLPLYALDSLPDDERAGFEEHLAACSDCLRELAAYEPVLTRLAAGVERAPDSHVKADVLARIRAVPQDPTSVPGPVAQPVPLRRAQRSPSRWLAMAAAVLALALVVVSGTGLALWRRTQTLENQLAQARDEADLATIMMADDAEMIDLDTQVTGHLSLAMAPSLGTGMVLAEDLEAPPQDQAYQLWVLDDGRPRSAGMVSGHSGVIGRLTDMTGVDGVAVSIEPASGSTAPTGPVVAQAEFG